MGGDFPNLHPYYSLIPVRKTTERKSLRSSLPRGESPRETDPNVESHAIGFVSSPGEGVARLPSLISMSPTLIIALSVILCFAVLLLLGVVGGNRAHGRALRELEADVVSIDERLTREQKKRAGVALQDGRRSHMDEAAAIAASHQAQKPTASRMPGRANGVTLSE